MDKDTKNEIDDYTKALLDSQKESHSSTKEEKDLPLSPEEKMAAEGRLENALDQLRKQRGQKPIRQEEKDYRKKHSLDIPDFTTRSIQYDSDDDSLKSIQKELDQKQNRDRHTITRTRLIRVDEKDRPLSRQRKNTHDLSLTDTLIRTTQTGRIKLERLQRTLTDPDDVETHGVLTESEKRRFRFKTRLISILVCVCVLALLLTGYAYKTLVYDPAHTITPSMQETYNKLQEYADEWDMSSDTEKSELLGYKTKYNRLLDSQKQDINAYFKEQTGSKLTKIFKELKVKNQQSKQEALTRLQDYISNWLSYTNQEKEMILNYVDVYQSLSDADKQTIDNLATEITGTNFSDLVDQEQALANSYEDEIADLKAQLKTYKEYGESLLSYQSDPESYGFTEEELQKEIDSNNDMISSIKQSIKDYQAIEDAKN